MACWHVCFENRPFHRSASDHVSKQFRLFTHQKKHEHEGPLGEADVVRSTGSLCDLDYTCASLQQSEVHCGKNLHGTIQLCCLNGDLI